MEKGIISYIRKQFELKEVDIHTYSPLTLAYIGDGIFDLIVRTVVVGRGNANVGNLHKKTSHVVKAQTQAKMIGQLLPYLTEEEADIYRRGRNAHSPTMAKNATMSDYRKYAYADRLSVFRRSVGTNPVSNSKRHGTTTRKDIKNGF